MSAAVCETGGAGRPSRQQQFRSRNELRRDEVSGGPAIDENDDWARANRPKEFDECAAGWRDGGSSILVGRFDPMEPQIHFVEGGTGSFTAASSRRFHSFRFLSPPPLVAVSALSVFFPFFSLAPLGPLPCWGSLAGATPRPGPAVRFSITM